MSFFFFQKKNTERERESKVMQSMKKKKRVPKGTSDYQAAWILDEDSDAGEEAGDKGEEGEDGEEDEYAVESSDHKDDYKKVCKLF